MKKILLCLFIIFLFFLFKKDSLATGAASLILSPQTGTYTNGQTFSIIVKVDTGGEKINQVKMNLNYPTANLDFVEAVKTGSFVTNWLMENSTTPGLLTYTGGLPTPGAVGTDLTFITLNFRAKTAGSISLAFASGSTVYLDQPGTTTTTNILSLTLSQTGNYTISSTSTNIDSSSETATTDSSASETLPDTAGEKELLVGLVIASGLFIFFGLKRFSTH